MAEEEKHRILIKRRHKLELEKIEGTPCTAIREGRSALGVQRKVVQT